LLQDCVFVSTMKNGLVTFAAFSEAFLPLEASKAPDSVVQLIRAYLGSLPRYVGVALRELQEVGRNACEAGIILVPGTSLVLWIEYVVFVIQDCVIRPTVDYLRASFHIFSKDNSDNSVENLWYLYVNLVISFPKDLGIGLRIGLRCPLSFFSPNVVLS